MFVSSEEPADFARVLLYGPVTMKTHEMVLFSQQESFDWSYEITGLGLQNLYHISQYLLYD